MVIGDTNMPDTAAMNHPSGLPQEKIDNIMGSISNTGTVKMNNHRKKLRQRFDIIKKLGQGTYGKVQLGINKESGQEVAIKTIKKCKIEAEADLIRIRREVQIMSSVQHPNIIHIYEVFENREKMVLVMEFAAGGELYDYLSERKVLSEDEARRIFRQVSTAVYYCHKHKICHRDLKLENILLDEHGNAKIADFGLSNVFDDQKLLATFCGSPLYASPEIVKGTPYQGPEVDCWSLGVLLYTLVYGAMPFDGSNFKRLVKQISQGDYYEPKKPSSASPLIREMLTVCPQRRATIEQICSHWWVNEGYGDSCLDLAEELANQTPVRLDVLLSLTPASITADQLVVPSLEDSKTNDRVLRSHSVGSIRDVGNTEAEQRILDMVAAGGEAAIMPSPTRTITPTQSPIQPKRKLENTISTENVTGRVKKRERPTESLRTNLSKLAISELDNEEYTNQDAVTEKLGYEKESGEKMAMECSSDDAVMKNERPNAKSDNKESEDGTKVVKPAKVIKKFVDKHKTADLVASINQIPESNDETLDKKMLRKNSLPDNNLKCPERRRSRVIEAVERLQNTEDVNTEKNQKPVCSQDNALGKPIEKLAERQKDTIRNESCTSFTNPLTPRFNEIGSELNDSKSSLLDFSLEEARRSMENSIALLNQAKCESNNVAEPVYPGVTNKVMEREKKLKNAREIIGNAIQPGVGRLCSGARKPPVPFGLNGRSISGSVVSPSNLEKRIMRQHSESTGTCSFSLPSPPTTETKFSIKDRPKKAIPPNELPAPTVKTSRAEITLKSATLPRRKNNKAEVQLEIKPNVEEPKIRFSTEMQHIVPDIKSAPVKDTFSAYSPLSLHQRASSLEPTLKEHVIPIQRPPVYIRSGSLSRQSTYESDTDTAPGQSYSTLSTSSQPIKKSPREFIIPIAVEGGGIVTPRAGSSEPPDFSYATNNSFNRFGRFRRVGPLLSDANAEEDPGLQKFRKNSTLSKVSDVDEPLPNMHRLRSSKPVKKSIDDGNDSQSSGEDDDEDGFEILTAENLFSTLLHRVRALTNRLHVNNDLTSGFSNPQFFTNIRQPQSAFWQHEPFGSSRLNNSGSAWRHSISRDIGSDIDSMFSRTGATLPRDGINKARKPKLTSSVANNDFTKSGNQSTIDLNDLDLSRLQLTKKDIETLSFITPGLPKCFQDQLLAKLPPHHARKLSRTLSMQNYAQNLTPPTFMRSLSSGDKKIQTGKDYTDLKQMSEKEKRHDCPESETPVSKRKLHKNTASNLCRPNSCRNTDIYNNRPLDSSYHCDVNSEYRYYSPIQKNHKETKEFLEPVQSNELSLTSLHSPNKDKKLNPAVSVSSKNSHSNCNKPRNSPRNLNDYKHSEPKNQESEMESLLLNIRGKRRDRSCSEKPEFSNITDLPCCSGGDQCQMDFTEYNKNLRLQRFSEPRDVNSEITSHQECLTKPQKLYAQKSSVDIQQILQDIDNISFNKINSLSQSQTKSTKSKCDPKKITKKTITDANSSKKTSNDSKDNNFCDKNNSSKCYVDHFDNNKVTDTLDIIEKKSKLVRPKSYPYRSLDILKNTSTDVETRKDRLISDSLRDKEWKTETSDHFSKQRSDDSIKNPVMLPDKEIDINKPEDFKEYKVKIKKIIKVPKKKGERSLHNETKINDAIRTESKMNTGILHKFGQNSVKLNGNSKSEELIQENENSNKKPPDEKKEKRISKISSEVCNSSEKDSSEKQNKASRINVMIRALRERSVPRLTFLTESGLIKRAVSVENISETQNKKKGNIVINLFKKFGKPDLEKKNPSPQSISDLEINSKSKASADCSNSNDFDLLQNNQLNKDKENQISHIKKINNSNSSFPTDVSTNTSNDTLKKAEIDSDISNNNNNIQKSNYSNTTSGNKNMIKNDNFSKNDTNTSREKLNCHISDDNDASLLSNDDCDSTSTLVSPTDEPDSYFENWSVCSEDNFRDDLPLRSSDITRRSFFSPVSINDNQTESVIDRIKRRSFYCRFNEKKPRRQSNIVGPASRDYYRESVGKSRWRQSENLPTEFNYQTPTRCFDIKTTNNNLNKPALLSTKFPKDSNISTLRRSPIANYSSTTDFRSTLVPRRYADSGLHLTHTLTNSKLHANPSTLYNPISRFSTMHQNNPTVSNISSYATLGRSILPYYSRSISSFDSSVARKSPSVEASKDNRSSENEVKNERSKYLRRASSTPKGPPEI